MFVGLIFARERKIQNLIRADFSNLKASQTISSTKPNLALNPFLILIDFLTFTNDNFFFNLNIELVGIKKHNMTSTVIYSCDPLLS